VQSVLPPERAAEIVYDFNDDIKSSHNQAVHGRVFVHMTESSVLRFKIKDKLVSVDRPVDLDEKELEAMIVGVMDKSILQRSPPCFVACTMLIAERSVVACNFACVPHVDSAL